MMFRTPLRLLTVLAVWGSLTLSINGASAQTTPNELIPQERAVPRSAFKPTSGDAVSAAGGQVLETGPIAAAAPFTDMMLQWRSNAVDLNAVQIQVRVSLDGQSWSRWGNVAVSDDPPGVDEPADQRSSTLIPADPSRFFQVRVTLHLDTSGALPTFEDFRTHTVDTRIANEQAPQPTTGDDMTMQGVGRPAYVSRTQWGSPDGQGSRAPVARRPVTHLVVHHTADSDSLSSGQTDWAARVRAYWTFHAITNGWGDIGYNWIIDPNGVIYEGRSGSPSDTAAGGAVGFHDTANYGSMGVSLIGTYSTKTPTSAAQNSLVEVLAWKASERNINPTGTSFYYGCSISNYCIGKIGNANIPNIAGHRQVTPGHTTCPGDAFMGIMSSIRERVVQRINGTPDNGDTLIDETESTFTTAGSFKTKIGCGWAGSTKWTYASNEFDSVPNENSGVWRPNLAKTGMYKVRIHVPQGCGLQNRSDYATTNARYKINFSGGSAEQWVNQQTPQPYLDFGPFKFDAGTSGNVTLTDLTSEPFIAGSTTNTVIFFDAVEWFYQEPPPQPIISARLVEAKIQSSTVPTDGLVQVQFKVKNTGTEPIGTQSPDGGTVLGSVTGWTYDESGCFKGAGTSFDKQDSALRVTLGFASGSTFVPTDCYEPTGGNPWRWGLRTTIQPGETRTIIGYVRFRTPGTYYFNANLVQENVRYFGADEAGTAVRLGPVKVTAMPHKVWLPRASR